MFVREMVREAIGSIEIVTALAPGTYTPSMAFGADYVLALEGVILSRVAL